MKNISTLFAILLIGTLLIYAQNYNLSLEGQLTYTQSISDIWGYVDQQGNEYALVGAFNGFSVVDISDPANPVEVFFNPGANSTWRDIKTWNDHAYVTNESTGGLLIVDLSTLPGQPNLDTVTYHGSTYPFSSAHNLYIDENGICYIIGADYGSRGAIMLDLSVDPEAPVEVGIWDNYGIHDAIARGDTLWAAALGSGFQAVIDVSNGVLSVELGVLV